MSRREDSSRRLAILILVLAVAAAVGVGSMFRKPMSTASVLGEGIGKGHSFIYEGPMPTEFSEAPELAALVAKGELPPVEERLPEEPLVIPPVERIGKYGGTWRRAFTGPADGQNIDRLQHDHVLYYDLDGTTLMPHIAKSWEVKDGGRVFELKLRKGMKWSDGHPFTADDFEFAHNELILNDDLVPVKPPWLRPGGKLGKFKKVDETTIRYEFAEPYYILPRLYGTAAVAGQSAAGAWQTCVYAPGHYLKQFHPDYASKENLKKEVEGAGLDNWVQLFRQRSDADRNPDLPVVAPWVMEKPITSRLFTLKRNPYYWAVDPEGNQLPYIDRITMHLTQNMEALNLRAMRGDIDMQHRHVKLADVPVLVANADKGGYRVRFWRSYSGTACAIYVNQTYREKEIEMGKKPEVGKWLANRQFRIALSHGVDRDAINDLVFLGTGTPRAVLCAPQSPYYPGPKYEHLYSTLDIEKANAILDDIGLKEKNRDGFRLRSDGEGPLVITISVTGDAFVDYAGVAQLLAEHWARIGLKIHVSVLGRNASWQRTVQNEHHITMWETGASDAPFGTAPIGSGCAYGPLIGLWYESGGKKGIEPTGLFKEMIDLYEQSVTLPPAECIAAGQELWRIHAENLFMIGTVGASPAFNGVVVVKKNFRNVPDEAPNDSALQNPGPARPEQFFVDN